MIFSGYKSNYSINFYKSQTYKNKNYLYMSKFTFTFRRLWRRMSTHSSVLRRQKIHNDRSLRPTPVLMYVYSVISEPLHRTIPKFNKNSTAILPLRLTGKPDRASAERHIRQATRTKPTVDEQLKYQRSCPGAISTHT